MLRKQLWKVSVFCGIDVLGYCWMDNHVHLLVRVPSTQRIDDSEIVRRCRALYGHDSLKVFQIESILFGTNEQDAEALRARLLARMHDLSQFVKEWKQRFGVWHNRKFNTFGTLWSERFKSLRVQDDPHVMRTVAAYIFLNPVRAKIVRNPDDYRFSLYGECCSGGESDAKMARNAFGKLLGCSEFQEARKMYASYLRRLDPAIGDNHHLKAKTPTHESAPTDDAFQKGAMSRGAVIGTADFVERWLEPRR